jgi:hypothetical protein
VVLVGGVVPVPACLAEAVRRRMPVHARVRRDPVRQL